jgi:exodeoxyribonuclease VII small subunit
MTDSDTNTSTPLETSGSQTLTYEQAFSKLETIVGRLETGDSSLDESVTLYQEGMSLAKFCADQLAAIEHQISQLIVGQTGEVREASFGEEHV